MKKIKTFIIVFDALMLLIIAGLWAEQHMQKAASAYVKQENIPAMKTAPSGHAQEETQEPEQTELQPEETDYYELEEKKIAITFDDGPNTTYTPVLLQGLRDRNVKATFFVIGKNVEKHPEIIRQMHQDGHIIGNHTYSHIQLKTSNRETFKEELKKTNEAIRRITGEDTIYVRPPYGSWDKEFEKELNLFPVLWDVDPRDWNTQNLAQVEETILSQIEENSIILLHDQYDTSVTAALEIIDKLSAEGYQFVTVDQILFD